MVQKVSDILATHERRDIITYSDVTAGLVLEQLTCDVFARGTCSRWHFPIILPVTAGRVCIKSRRCRVCNPGGCNQSCRFACDKKIELFAFSRKILSLFSLSFSICFYTSILISFSLFLSLSLSPLLVLHWRSFRRVRAFVNHPFGSSRSFVSASDFIAFKRAKRAPSLT